MKKVEIASSIDDIFNFCSQYDYIFLYGAGKIAKMLAEVFQRNDIIICGCCVSRKISDDDMGTLPVYVFPDVGRPLSKCGFVLAMSEKFQREVEASIFDTISDCNYLHLSPYAIHECNQYLSYEPKRESRTVATWRMELKDIVDKPCVLFKRTKGLGDVLAFEPIARKLKTMGYRILVATQFKDIFRYNHVADGIFYGTNVPSFVERNCLVFDMTYAYAITPFSHILDGYVDFVRTLLPDFSLSQSERMPIYDADLIREHGTDIKKICVNNEATEWKSRIYSPEKMREFVLYLQRKGYEIYEIGGNVENYLGVGKNCFGMELHDTVKLMSEMDLYVGLDNGLLHLAQSIHLPVFALFGCVCPLFRVHDWSRARVLWKNVDELSCAGCWSRRRLPCDVVVCDQEEHYCMDWSVSEVIEAFENLEYNNPPRLYREMRLPLRII